MKWSELNEGMRRTDGITKDTLLQAIHHYIIEEINDEYSKQELMQAYTALRSNLTFPKKVYRALYFDQFDEYGEEPLKEKIATIKNLINWQSLGTSWTWDKDCAVAGGALDNAADRHVVLSATVPAKSVDLVVSLWMNLTTYEEEKEVRLFPNTPIVVDELFLEIEGGVKITEDIPTRTNTGAESWDKRDGRVDDIKAALLARERGISVGQANVIMTRARNGFGINE